MRQSRHNYNSPKTRSERVTGGLIPTALGATAAVAVKKLMVAEKLAVHEPIRDDRIWQ